MSTFELVQVTDTHLSGTRAYFLDNWEVFVREMENDPPDLIINTGDVSLRGSEGAEDLAFARAEMERLPSKVLVLPGNHDIGDTPPDPRLDRPIDDARRQRWLKHFGDDKWVEDFAGWRLYGLNAQLLDSGLGAEAEQLAWFERALQEGEGRPGALFLHKPLYYKDPDDEVKRLACLYPTGRRVLMELCRRFAIRFVASGHLHCYRTTRHQGIRMVWAPATAFINTKRKKRPPVRVKRCVGYLRYSFEGASVRHALIEPDLFINHDTRNISKSLGSTIFLPPYPQRQWKKAAQ